MDALISGCAGRALLILDDRSLISIDVRDPNTLVKRREEDLPFLFGEATDLIVVENVELDYVRAGLQNEFEFACALDLILLSLDSDARISIRENAVEQLERLLSHERIAARLRDVLYLRPLPPKADVAGAIACCELKRTTKTAEFLRKLQVDQPVIRQTALRDEAMVEASSVIEAERPEPPPPPHARPWEGDEQSALQQVDLICFSHLRWDFVYQRPQHLLTRASKETRVFFFEEPVFDSGSMRLDISQRAERLRVVVPHLPIGLRSKIAISAVLTDMVSRLLIEEGIDQYLAWYYTPMALDFTRHLRPRAVIYDCMDELSAFKGAPQSLTLRERELFKIADLVFTGGQSLYEAKRDLHQSVFAFPSSIDRDHFMQARTAAVDPPDQQDVPNPRLGFFGVVDERFDVELLDEVSRSRRDWHFVIIGPVVKIDPEILPQRDNIHYLGGKSYQDLPAYIAGWDVALLLFAQNESTRFISPTKTPEYLAAGKHVVSTPIRDVVSPYGHMGLVSIATNAHEFIAAVEDLFKAQVDHKQWLETVDAFLEAMSWDNTWSRMSHLISDVLVAKRRMADPSHVTGEPFYLRHIA